MTKIYDRFKAQEDSVEKRVDEEQRMEMETDARRAQEKEMKRVQARVQYMRTRTALLQHVLCKSMYVPCIQLEHFGLEQHVLLSCSHKK